jgi:CheY-like chemotaxis protein
VVALTGHALAGHEEGARNAGCDSFVTKPCIPADLEAEIPPRPACEVGRARRR